MNRSTLQTWIDDEHTLLTAAIERRDQESITAHARAIKAYTRVLEWEEEASAHIDARLPAECTGVTRQ